VEPCTKRRGKAEGVGNANDSFDDNIVEKPLDIKKDHRCSDALLFTSPRLFTLLLSSCNTWLDSLRSQDQILLAR
jgi:hypothetical protein